MKAQRLHIQYGSVRGLGTIIQLRLHTNISCRTSWVARDACNLRQVTRATS